MEAGAVNACLELGKLDVCRSVRDVGMKRVHSHIIAVATLAFTLTAPNVYAFIDPPWIMPAAPRSGEVVSAKLRMGICDAVAFRPGYPQITQQGNQIRLVEYGDRAPTEDLCIYPILTTTQPIGSFTPGDYVLTVDFTYDNYPFGLTTITLGVIPFTVTGATTATQVPALTFQGMVALLIILSCPAYRRLRIRRNQC
jgi:hypothetical protein